MPVVADEIAANWDGLNRETPMDFAKENQIPLDNIRALVASTINIANISGAFNAWPYPVLQVSAKDSFCIAFVEDSLEKEFNERAERWKRDTSFQSSLVAKIMHEDYQAIMVMGTPAIPLILNRLKNRPEHWFWALKFLAKRDIAEGAEKPSDAARAWLKWGKEKGYVS
jgi:hypothetical protein